MKIRVLFVVALLAVNPASQADEAADLREIKDSIAAISEADRPRIEKDFRNYEHFFGSDFFMDKEGEQIERLDVMLRLHWKKLFENQDSLRQYAPQSYHRQLLTARLERILPGEDYIEFLVRLMNLSGEWPDGHQFAYLYVLYAGGSDTGNPSDKEVFLDFNHEDPRVRSVVKKAEDLIVERIAEPGFFELTTAPDINTRRVKTRTASILSGQDLKEHERHRRVQNIPLPPLLVSTLELRRQREAGAKGAASAISATPAVQSVPPSVAVAGSDANQSSWNWWWVVTGAAGVGIVFAVAALRRSKTKI
jgi:hypothetical protein